jgi:hypothetical protein
MHHRLIAILAVFCFALGAAGCESLFPSWSKPKPSKKKKRERKQYETVLMPLQTGSTLQRRMLVEKKSDDEPEPKKKAKKKESAKPKPEAEPTATPAPTEEATPEPTPERFR